MRLSLIRALLLGCLAFLPSGCNQIAAANALKTPTQPPSAMTIPAETGTKPAVPTQFDDMPKDPPLSDPAIPESQMLIEKAKADLAQRLSIPASQINTRDIRKVLWPDNSLGCPQPGMTYTQAVVQGYLILLESTGKEFEYHADLGNDVFYCENPTPPLQAPP